MDGNIHFSTGNFQDTFGDIFLKALESLSDNGIEILKGKDNSCKDSVPTNFVKNLTTPQNFCSLDMYDDGSDIHIIFDIPGVQKRDTKLEVTKLTNVYLLTLTVSRTIEKPNSKDGTKGKFERFSGVKSREVHLPLNIDTNSITAKQNDGVLFVTIKKIRSDNSSVNIPII